MLLHCYVVPLRWMSRILRWEQLDVRCGINHQRIVKRQVFTQNASIKTTACWMMSTWCIISVVLSCICLIILMFLLIIPIIQLKSKSHKIDLRIIIIYFVADIASISQTIFMLTISSTCKDISRSELPNVSFSALFPALYLIVFFCIACTLVLRLYLTFKESAIPISKCQTWFFIISCILWILLGFVYIMALSVFSNVELQLIASSISIIFYNVSCIYAIIIFAHKMHKLINLMATSIDNTNDNQNGLGYKVIYNGRQRKYREF